jgi:hypothetical protein
VEPELSPGVHLEKHTNSTNNTPIVIPKKNNVPLPAFPPSLRLKEPQTKLTSLIPPERLQEISLGRIFGAATPPGALVFYREGTLNAIPTFLFAFRLLLGLLECLKQDPKEVDLPLSLTGAQCQNIL